MTAIGQRLRLRLFVEGVEIPIIAAQIQAVPNAPIAASLQVLPLAEGTRLHPRSLVHLFFLDTNEQDNPLLSLRGDSVAKGQENSSWEKIKRGLGPENSNELVMENDLSTDYQNYKYKLCFVGELSGFTWTKTPVNRSLILQCLDLSNYWDYAYQYRNDDIFGPGYKAMFSGGATNQFTDFLSEPGAVVVSILKQPSTQYPALKGLLGGIVHLCEAIGGSYYYQHKYAGQNIFFSLAELRLHVTQLITAYDEDPTGFKLLGGGYDGLFGRSLGNLGEQASIRKCINALSAVIFHETFAQPCPYYIPGTEGTVSGQVRAKIPQSFIKNSAQGLINSLGSVLEALTSVETSDTGFIGKKAAIVMRKQLIQQLAKARAECQSTAQRAKRAKLDTVVRFFTTAAVSIASAGTLFQRWRPGDFSAVVEDIALDLNLAIDDLKRARDAEIKVTAKKDQKPARLCQQIFRPDVWFSAPPRCNVIFPDDYMQLSYARKFMEEPTRLLLKTNDEFFGEDSLFDHYYFAPKAITLREQKNKLESVLKNDIFDHELFTGILPVFEKMGEMNIFAIRSGMTPDGKTPKVGLAQRAANFLYFKYRFASRQLQIQARFLPYVACGFPGLIIDKYVDPDTIKRFNEMFKQFGGGEREVQQMLGTHFLGNFTEVLHSLSQNTGTTQINVGYARQPEESAEFLGVRQDDEETTVQKKTGKETTRSSLVASLFPPAIGAQGPNKGRVTFVEEVTKAYKTDDFDNGPKLQAYANNTSIKLTSKVPVGLPTRAEFFGPDIVKLAGDKDLIISFRGFRVFETVAQFKKEKVDLPPEEYIRPGWYGDVWHSMNIHKAYLQFLGTGSITETTQVLDIHGNEVGLVTNDAQQALADALAATASEGAPNDVVAGLALTKGSSIQQAVAFLVLTYSYIKSQNLNRAEFIKAYNYRPIANMVDMFGSSDLQLTADGTKVVSGVEGFHSRAFGPYEDLFGLVTPDISDIVGIKRGTVQAQKADTRKRKFDAVISYATNLRFSRALLG